MPVPMNIFFIMPLAAGVLAIGVAVYSFLSEVDFYPGRHHKADAKPMPRWYGRLFFGGIGLLLIYVSLSKLHP